MAFFFRLLDILLTTIMLFDTLGLTYQFRKEGNCDSKEYIRICLTWVFFLLLSNLLSCEMKGFFGIFIRLAFFGCKAYIVLPILGGTLKIYKIFIEDGKAELFYKRIIYLINSKICKGNENCPSSQSEINNDISETVTPQ